MTKTLDATRPEVDNDGWEHTESTDLFTLHDYARTGAVLYEKYKDVSVQPGTRIPNNGRPALAPGYKYNGTPLVLSEFGGISFIPAGHTVPQESWGYSGVEKSADAALDRLRDLYEAILKLPFAGVCYTQLTDVGRHRVGSRSSRLSNPAAAERVFQLKLYSSTGVCPRGPRYGNGAGAGSAHFRRRRRSCALPGGLFFNPGPYFLLPGLNHFLVAFARLAGRSLRTPAQIHQHFPHMPGMVADAELPLDQIGHPRAAPQRRLVTEPLRPLPQALLQSLAWASNPGLRPARPAFRNASRPRWRYWPTQRTTVERDTLRRCAISVWFNPSSSRRIA